MAYSSPGDRRRQASGEQTSRATNEFIARTQNLAATRAALTTLRSLGFPGRRPIEILRPTKFWEPYTRPDDITDYTYPSHLKYTVIGTAEGYVIPDGLNAVSYDRESQHWDSYGLPMAIATDGRAWKEPQHLRTNPEPILIYPGREITLEENTKVNMQRVAAGLLKLVEQARQ